MDPRQTQPIPDGGQDDHDGNSLRPSFTSFWKRGRRGDAAAGGADQQRRGITFVSSSSMGTVETGEGSKDGNNNNNNTSPEKSSDLDKAQLRRAQVRKAQIQHRQRKANYVKQLEIDVASYRDLISTTQRQAQQLRRENDSIRSQIFLSHQQKQQQETTPEMDFNFDFTQESLDDITLSLSYDQVLNAPAFQITSSPSESQYGSSSSSSQGGGSSPIPETTPDQTQEAINFILALEHICRAHFHTSTIPDTHSRESGHLLMASSLALRTAPDSVFTAASKSAPLLRFGGAQPQPSDLGQKIEWQADGLTLQTLYGLACSLNPAAELEVTPVQAWFELVGRFGVGVVMRGEVLGELKRELRGVVRCPHYGAVMERGAFESVVARVLGGITGTG
ncbi:alanine racemase, partial [Echria macrotheca]